MELELIEEIVSITAKRYENMLSKFRPTKPGGEYLEQNLITNFAIAFSQKFPNANIYTEIPFKCYKNQWKCRLDLYIENEDVGYIIEVKGSQAKDTLFELIEEDIKRIKSKELIESFKNMSEQASSTLPKKMIGLILADCWGGINKTENIQLERWKGYYNYLNQDFENIHKLKAIFYKQINLNSKYPYHIIGGVVSYNLLDNNL